MSHFRRIALTVEERESGHFYWVLIESKDDAQLCGELKACQGSCGTYMEALMPELPSCGTWPLGVTG